MKNIILFSLSTILLFSLHCFGMNSQPQPTKNKEYDKELFTNEELQKEQQELDEQLFEAVGNNKLEEATELIHRGANVNAQYGIFGQTPLHDACLLRHDTIVYLLLLNQANPNIQSKLHNMTPLHFAIIQKYTNKTVAIVTALKNAGARTNICDKQNKMPYYYACRKYRIKVRAKTQTHIETKILSLLQLILSTLSNRN